MNEEVKILDSLLDKMIELDATDMHLVHNQPVKFRIDKKIRNQDKHIRGMDIFKILNNAKALPTEKMNKFHIENRLDFSYQYKNHRFRGNLSKEKGQYTCVIRRLSDSVIDVKKIGLPGTAIKQIENTTGLILVTGPTGSGKTTTLTSLVDYLNKKFEINILTIEDPIEYIHKPKKATITQQEVGSDVPSFASAMKSALRRDPDVILIGEMRDLETIEIACQAAETGHLVFGTLHTNSAISSIDRIVNVFPGIERQNIRSQLASNLRMIINQRLLPRKEGGLVPAYETLIVTNPMRHAIRDSDYRSLERIIADSKSIGNQLLSESVEKLKNKGIVDKNEIF